MVSVALEISQHNPRFSNVHVPTTESSLNMWIGKSKQGFHNRVSTKPGIQGWGTTRIGRVNSPEELTPCSLRLIGILKPCENCKTIKRNTPKLVLIPSSLCRNTTKSGRNRLGSHLFAWLESSSPFPHACSLPCGSPPPPNPRADPVKE
jgi:hypothetical protein